MEINICAQHRLNYCCELNKIILLKNSFYLIVIVSVLLLFKIIFLEKNLFLFHYYSVCVEHSCVICFDFNSLSRRRVPLVVGVTTDYVDTGKGDVLLQVYYLGSSTRANRRTMLILVRG